jgi:hypothetical protein
VVIVCDIAQPGCLIGVGIIGRPGCDELADGLPVKIGEDVSWLETACRIGVCRGQAGNDSAVANEAQVEGESALSSRRPYFQRTPQICMGVMDLTDEFHQLELIVGGSLCQRDAWQKFAEDPVPVFADDASVGIPILDDVPETEQREDLEAGVRESNSPVIEFMIKGWVLDSVDQ